MVVIPPGSFRMGDLSGGSHKSEKPVREVRIGAEVEHLGHDRHEPAAADRQVQRRREALERPWVVAAAHNLQNERGLVVRREGVHQCQQLIIAFVFFAPYCIAATL